MEGIWVLLPDLANYNHEKLVYYLYNFIIIAFFIKTLVPCEFVCKDLFHFVLYVLKIMSI